MRIDTFGLEAFDIRLYTNADLPGLKQCLVNRGVNTGRIFRDQELEEDLLLIRNPEGNMMEIICRYSGADN